MGTVGGGMTAMLAMLKDQFGVDIARLMQAKTDAATVEAEKKSRAALRWRASSTRAACRGMPSGRTRPSSRAWTAAGTTHFQEFARVHLKAGARTDFIAVPGGIEPLTLVDLMPKDFNFFRRRIEALVESHGTSRIVAIAHEDCAWYKSRKIGPWTIDLRERQITDLRRASARLREMFDGVTVETYFARFSKDEPKRVVFELV